MSLKLFIVIWVVIVISSFSFLVNINKSNENEDKSDNYHWEVITQNRCFYLQSEPVLKDNGDLLMKMDNGSIYTVHGGYIKISL